MAETPSRKPFDEPITNPVIKKLNPEPLDQRAFVTVIGYVGTVSADYIQVYPELDLRTYYLIPNDSQYILYQAQIDKTDPSSQTKFVLEASTPVKVVKVDVDTVEACFLSGSIADTHLGSAKTAREGTGASPQTIATAPSPFPICAITQFVFGPIPSPVTACAFNTQCLGDEPVKKNDK
jgi:hypothetical protein